MALRKRKHTRHSIVILTLLPYTQTTSQDCNPCLSASDNSFKVKPGTNCKEYAQCFDSEVASEFACEGDTVYDEAGQYCNWPDSVTCVETGCPPTPAPTDGGMTTGANETVTESDDCPNPCFGTTSGFKILPGTNCKMYVQCSEGEVYSPELECEGDTIFNQAGGYCDWITSVTCEPAPCPETPAPSMSPDATGMPSAKPSVLTEEPSTPMVSPTSISPIVASNNESLSSPPIAVNNSVSLNSTSSNSTNATSQSVPVNCSNPCPSGIIGFQVWPNTNCTKYVQCNDGTVVQEFQCPSGMMFFEETGGCRTVDESGSVDGDIWSVQGTNLCPDVTCLDDTSTSSTMYPSSSSSSTDPPVSVPIVPVISQHANTAEPTAPRQSATKLVSIYENFRKDLYQRQEMFDVIVFQSLYGPSVEYTFDDLMNSLNVVVYQLPVSLAFYIGESEDLVGINYGLVNLAAMLANAMAEGIKIDSCDEWNTDDIDGEKWKFPLSNSCGQFRRTYQAEICRDDVASMCPLIKTMNITATSSPQTHSPASKGPPPLSCRLTSNKTFAGYYDSLTDTIVQSAYANSVGKTQIEGCCWWGRGALLTRGRCILGKLNKYLGKQAADEGYNSPYKYIDFCQQPNAICDSYISPELRWTIAFLEWSDVVQNYVHVDDDWNYWDQLKSFVDGGMVDNEFIEAVVNILIRKCYDGSCNDYEIPFKEERKNNFRRIIGEVLNLPLSGDMVPDIPTREPTSRPTARPTREKKEIVALPPNSAQRWKTLFQFALTGAMIVIHVIVL